MAPCSPWRPGTHHRPARIRRHLRVDGGPRASFLTARAAAANSSVRVRAHSALAGLTNTATRPAPVRFQPEDSAASRPRKNSRLCGRAPPASRPLPRGRTAPRKLKKIAAAIASNTWRRPTRRSTSPDQKLPAIKPCQNPVNASKNLLTIISQSLL